MRIRVLALALALCGCKPVIQPAASVSPIGDTQPMPAPPAVTPPPLPETAKPLIALPSPPALTPLGHNLILEFETDGRSGYKPHPEWPRGQSGITVGIGYDCGYFSSAVIKSDWNALQRYDRDRLAGTSGKTGERAHALLSTMVDILVQWEYAIGVFDNIDVAREFSSARHALPGFDGLRPNAQAALISLGFNRGWQLSGPSRSEMRTIRGLVPSANYSAMAAQLRSMSRVWRGTVNERGLTRRRYAEAKLMETE